MSKQNRAAEPSQSSLESPSDVRPNADTEFNPAGPIHKNWLNDVSAQELVLVGSRGYSQQQLFEEVNRRLAIRRKTMSAEEFARLKNPATRNDFPCPFSAEALAEVTLLGFLKYAELCKPGGEFEQIVERHGGRLLTDEEAKELLGDEEEWCYC